MADSPRITSRHNPRVKLASLLRQRKGRDEQGRFLIDGARELSLALAAGIEVVEVFACDELCRSEAPRAALAELSKRRVEIVAVAPAILEHLAFGERTEGLVAVARPPRRTLADLALPPLPLVAVLEGVEKPGNVGAVLRSADAAGVSALVVADPHTDLYNPNAVRASLGTIFSVPTCAASAAETLAWLRREKLAIYAARPDATTDYAAADFRRPAAIVLGSEAHGLTAVWNAPDVIPIRLPMHGRVDSLNVSATAAVLFYEAVRQRANK